MMAELIIENIKDAGDVEKERVVMLVTDAGNLERHILLRLNSSKTNILGGAGTSFWFPNEEVSKGDTVVLYTKSGKFKKKDIKDNVAHFFYWGKSASLWGSDKFAAAIGEYYGWKSFKLGGFQDESDIEPNDA